MIHLTEHAKQRMRQRCGIPYRAAVRQAQRAWIKGIRREEVSGTDRIFLDRLYVYQANPLACTPEIRMYGRYAWVYDNGNLITVIAVPNGTKGAGNGYPTE